MSSVAASTWVELEMGRIRELSKKGRHSEALRSAEILAAAAPENRDVLYLIAANQRCLNRIPDALATLQRLEQQHPSFSLLYQERGCCYTTLRDIAHAIDAFRQGVNINPTLVKSWSMLERLYRIAGDAKNVAIAAEQLATLKRLPPELVQAGSLVSDSDLSAAEKILRAYLLKASDQVDALRLLARVLIERQKYLQARDEIDTLLKLEPGNNDYLSLYAAACVGLGEHQQAIALYRQLLGRSPESPELRVPLGHCLRAVGRQKEATECYQVALAARPSFGDAYWSLANLKNYCFSVREIADMRGEEAASAVTRVDRYHLCFALGKAFEDRGEYAESWQFYERGNLLKRTETRYRPEITEINTRKQIEVCTTQFFGDRASVGTPDFDPIFIVGLPRSGSTLIEQILSSHSQVEGTQELADIQRIVLELCGYPDVLADLTPEDFRRLGERYISDTRAYRRSKKPFFVDKMPNNFRHIGLIHLMLPYARIIDVRREPVACCFSNLKQLFAKGQDFTYSIEDIARYYRTYLDLMQHWDSVLPGRVLRILYEDVVADLEPNVRRILEFCGLAFEAGCLEFYKTERSVCTASSEQVRQPIFREGLSQWRNYEHWLEPLKNRLGHALIRYRE